MVPAHCSCCRNHNSTPNHRRQDPLVCAAFAHTPSPGSSLLPNLLAHCILVLFRLVSLTTPPGQTLSNRLFDHPSRPKCGSATSATEAARQRQQRGASGGVPLCMWRSRADFRLRIGTCVASSLLSSGSTVGGQRWSRDLVRVEPRRRMPTLLMMAMMAETTNDEDRRRPTLDMTTDNQAHERARERGSGE